MLPVFISMTTISHRLKSLDRVLNRLLQQTRPADRIILNISTDPYMMDRGIRFEELPEQTRKFAVTGKVEVYFCKNTGPYRKVIPTIERFRGLDYFLITADDDVLYPPEWLEQLVESALTYSCIAAYRCRVLDEIDGKLTPYRSWPILASASDSGRPGDLNDDHPSLRLFPTGRDGVIYQSKHLKNVELLRELQQLAPGQDDVALKFATLLAEIPVVRASREKTSEPLGDFFDASAGGPTLWPSNVNEGNDLAISKVVEHCQRRYNFSIDRIFKSRP